MNVISRINQTLRPHRPATKVRPRGDGFDPGKAFSSALLGGTTTFVMGGALGQMGYQAGGPVGMAVGMGVAVGVLGTIGYVLGHTADAQSRLKVTLPLTLAAATVAAAVGGGLAAAGQPGPAMAALSLPFAITAYAGGKL